MPVVSDKLVIKPKPALNQPVPLGTGKLAGALSPRRKLLEATKSLVVAYGPREAARRLKLSQNTVLSWALRYRWKQAIPDDALAMQSTPSEALASAVRDDHKPARFHLAHWTRKAAESAAKHKKPLEIARKVRDVAAVYSTLYPSQIGEGILEIGLLVGKAEPSESASAGDDAPVIDVE